MIEAGHFVGKSIGNYHIVAFIGSGGFGSVYRGVHHVLQERIVALKILHNHLNSQQELSRFLQEAQLLEHMRHPHILQIFDAGLENGLPYLVTEYASHGSLRDLLKRSAHAPLPEEISLTILSQVGEALNYAHQQHIIHRDLKPENILFNVHNAALLADFGIASTLTTSSIKYSSVIGTPTYMAPEQFQGTSSKEGDQYALGCIAYELFTGRAPFTAPDFFAMGFKHLTDTPIDPSQLNPALPKRIEHAILKAMAKQREDRHSDVRAFLVALYGSENWERRQPTGSLPLFGNSQPFPPGDAPAIVSPSSTSEASTFILARTNELAQQTRQPTQQKVSMALKSDEESQWNKTRQILPTIETAWKGELPPLKEKRAARKGGILLPVACTVVAMTILASLFFVFFPKFASSHNLTKTPPVLLTATSMSPTSTTKVRVQSSQPTHTTHSSTPVPTYVAPTRIPQPTATLVRPTPTPTLVVTPPPTPTATKIPTAETFRVYFNAANSSGQSTTTQHSYSGTVSILISGYGQASSTEYSDAFYIYTDASGNLLSPPHTATCWVLYINGQPADSSVGLPSYNSSHTYSVLMNVSQPSTITFGMCDGQPSDNTGYLTVTVQQQ